MVVPSAGAVVLVLFPFSDLTQAKLRPAVCLAPVGRGDWVLCQITSQPFGDPLAIPIIPLDFSVGGLSEKSVARPGKLFTANSRLMIRVMGTLNQTAIDRIRNAVDSLFVNT